MRTRLKASVVGLLGLVLLLTPAIASADIALPIPDHMQGQNQWCWVAATQIIVEYHTGTRHSQCQYHQWGKGASDCPNAVGAFSDDMTRAMEAGGLAASGRVTSGPVSFAIVQNETNAGRPLLIRAGWKSNDLKSAHVVPIRGWVGDSTVRYLHIYTDPKPSEFRQQPYAWMVANDEPGWEWTHSRHEIGV